MKRRGELRNEIRQYLIYEGLGGHKQLWLDQFTDELISIFEKYNQFEIGIAAGRDDEVGF